MGTRPLARLLLQGLIAAVVLAAVLGLSPWPGQAEKESLEGHFLVASEKMPDPRFAETVIFMARHDQSGAMGLVVNRALGEAPLAELLARLDQSIDGVEGSLAVHQGGPVQPGLGFVIHTPDVIYGDSMRVGAEVAVTFQPEILQAIGRGQAPRRHLFLFGYAGWGPGQLEGELARRDWFILPYDEDLLFDQDDATKWDRALAQRGIEL